MRDSPVEYLGTIAERVAAEWRDVGPRESMGLAPLRPWHTAICQCGGGCESVLECRFWYYVRKTNDKERGGERQYPVGNYRLDAMFEIDGRKIGIELDGQEFHDERRDFDRDQWLLNHGGIDHIVRIPFVPMWYFPEATMQCLATWYPRFKLRGVNMFCVTPEEFREEMEGSVNGDGDYASKEAFMEYADKNFEIWHANNSDGYESGFAGSPMQWCHRMTWKTHFIKRWVAHERDRKRPQ